MYGFFESLYNLADVTAVQPVKYECDIPYVTSVLTMAKSGNNGMEETGLVTPTPGR